MRVRVRLHIIGNVRIKNVGKSKSCMVSNLPTICKQTVRVYAFKRDMYIMHDIDQNPVRCHVDDCTAPAFVARTEIYLRKFSPPVP